MNNMKQNNNKNFPTCEEHLEPKTWRFQMVMSNSKLRSAVFQQSHFLGVLIPEDITLTLEDGSK